MSDDKAIPSEPQDASPNFYRLIGNIASDWATLEYVVNQCVWDAAMVDEQLGACLTAQIVSLQSRLEALKLLLRARGSSTKLQATVNKFAEALRHPTELRNRAVHDALGVHNPDGDVRALQITARGKLVFELRQVTLDSLANDFAVISDFVNRALLLRDQIRAELATLPYTSLPRFPIIDRGTR